MNHHEFTLQIERLKNCFGDRAYPEERVKVIFKNVKNESAAWWERTVDGFISYLKHPPFMQEIFETLNQERERTRSNTKRNEDANAAICPHCQNVGVFLCVDLEQNKYAFRCYCDHGTNYHGTAIPKFSRTMMGGTLRFFDPTRPNVPGLQIAELVADAAKKLPGSAPIPDNDSGEVS